METMWRFVDYVAKEEPDIMLRSIVQIGDAYTEDGGQKWGSDKPNVDDQIMFYFADEEEFMRATKKRSEFDFVIMFWERMEVGE